MKVIKESGRYFVVSTGISAGRRMDGFGWIPRDGHETMAEAEATMAELYHVLKRVDTCYTIKYINGEAVPESRESCAW